jgi:hypothetical protein
MLVQRLNFIFKRIFSQIGPRNHEVKIQKVKMKKAPIGGFYFLGRAMGLECRPVAEHPRGYAAGPTSSLLMNSIIRFVDFKFFSLFSSLIASLLEGTSVFQNSFQGTFLLVYFSKP